MSTLVLESVGLALAADSRVDVEAGIIHGVKVLGQKSKNRRIYPASLLRERFGVYEGAQVYADHDYAQLKTGRARPLGQWGGVLRDVSCPGDVRADLHVLKETMAGRIILEAAQRCSDRFGLSPMHLIDTRKEADGTETVTAILECWSVDAVTRPATTRTLFEQEETMPDDMAMPAPSAPPAASIEDAFIMLQNAVMADTGLDDTERISVLKDVMKLKSKVLGGGEEEKSPDGETPTEESHNMAQPIMGKTGRRLDAIEKSLRAMTIRQLAGEALALDAQTMASLLALSDEAIPAQIDALKRQRRPRYSSGPARSTGRSVATESHSGARPGAAPRLTAGADREQVKKFYRS